MKKWTKRLLIGSSISLVVLGLFSFPLIRGRYQFRRLAESVKQGMSRSDVLRLADHIGYQNHYVWPKGSNDSDAQQPEKISDEFNFYNFMLSSVVLVTYDAEGKVKDVTVDQ